VPRYRKLLPYAGGKSHLRAKLLRRMPEHTCYVEVFGGGGALLAAKERSRTEVFNDLDERLVTLFRVAKHHPEALQLEAGMMLRARAEYDAFRDQPGLTDVQRAGRYLFLLVNTFGNSTQLQSFGTTTGRKHRWYGRSRRS